MTQDQPNQETATTEPATPPRRPDPPPYQPDPELIGFIEKGQKPPAKQGQGTDPGDKSADSSGG